MYAPEDSDMHVSSSSYDMQVSSFSYDKHAMYASKDWDIPINAPITL